MYAAAADAINNRYPNSLHVLSHNLGMSIELALKAFLVQHGLKEQDLRKLGHELAGLLKEAETHGLTSSGSRHFCLSVLGRLREIANEIIREVFESIFESIKGSTLFEEFMSEPGLVILSQYPERSNSSDWPDTQ